MIFDAVTKQESNTLSLVPFKKAIGISAQRAPAAQMENLLVFGEKLPTIKKSVELLIEEAIKRTRGNQSLAAALIGISHQALNKRLLRKQKGRT
jgi:DNA-binding NtrC family response regulator